LSQLGVIIFSLSIGLWEIAFFHLLRHALFKSLLFMCIGIYIHGMCNQQDLRGIGFQFNSMPVVSSYFLISSLSLRGFPFLSGFYSKDSIVELFQWEVIGVISYFLVLLCVLRTVLYRIRLIISLYRIEINSKVLVMEVGEHIVSLLPIFFLFMLSIMGGSLFFNRIVPVFIVSYTFTTKVLITIALIGLLMSIIIVTCLSLKLISTTYTRFWYAGLGTIWFLGDFFSLLRGLLVYRGNLLRGVDQGWIEFIGIQGVIIKIKTLTGGLDLGTELGVGVYLYGGLLIVLFIMVI
jgi:NADH:ubiquinone oxidoreductase subunit 5 (subunit L)/multisubunit Na+/H+ antiporter MnhA subunit